MILQYTCREKAHLFEYCSLNQMNRQYWHNYIQLWQLNILLYFRLLKQWMHFLLYTTYDKKTWTDLLLQEITFQNYTGRWSLSTVNKAHQLPLVRPADTHIPFTAVTTFLSYLQNNTETSSKRLLRLWSKQVIQYWPILGFLHEKKVFWQQDLYKTFCSQ